MDIQGVKGSFMEKIKSEKSMEGPTGGLFVVGTPIGNLGDFSDRAKEILNRADVVLAEDTRKTGRFLADIGIKKPMISCPDFNEDKRIADVLSHLQRGHLVCLVSDAGMPTISDPGFRIVRAVVAQGFRVSGIPGPSAVLLALAISGLPTDRFIFDGFFPRKPGKAKSVALSYLQETRTILFFESPHRIAKTLAILCEILGDNRQVVIARELTKTYEEVIRGPIAKVIASTQDRQWLGEITVVLAGAD